MLEQIEAAAELLQPIPETVQFYHAMEEGITFAVDVNFEREDLLETIHAFELPIPLLMGESYVHPNDRYCKKTGRECAGRRLVVHKAYFHNAVRDGEKIYLTYYTDSCKIEFRVNKNSLKPHLINVEPF